MTSAIDKNVEGIAVNRRSVWIKACTRTTKCLGVIVFLALAPFPAHAEETVKDEAKKIGHAVGSTVHDVGHEAKKVGKEVGQGAKKAGKTVGHVAKEGVEAVKEGGKEVGHAATKDCAPCAVFFCFL